MVGPLAIGATLAAALALVFSYSNPSSDPLISAYEAGSGAWFSGMAERVSASSFYVTPSSFSPQTSKLGDVLRFEKVSGSPLDERYSYPPGITLYRILYVSEDLDRVKVPASAFVLVPYSHSGEPSRTVVWTHGTSGITRDCAPSLQSALYYEFVGLFPLALAGYTVIAPDYAGQGSDTQFHYCAAASHAYDVANAVIASRVAFPRGLFTYEWVVVGHSEGGLTAWAVNEHEAMEPTGGFLGAVSLAPAMDPQAINQRALAIPELRDAMAKWGTSFYPSTFLESIRRLNQNEVDLSQWMTEGALKRLEMIQKGGCYMAGLSLFAGQKVEEVFKDVTWVNQSFSDAWTVRARTTGKDKLAGPMLVVEAEADEAVDPAVNKVCFDRNCALNKDSRIRHTIYPGMGHMEVVYAGQLEWVDFVRALFESDEKVLPKGCEEFRRNAITGGEGTSIRFSVKPSL
ncbi:hypothetical protein HDU93_005530 [Gonapodya sp. JEL0774]|nr:hypothetical protein HDU93_005530 [Gonapodya sp. JEL0774]